MANHAQQIADFQHRTTRRVEQLLTTEQRCDPRTFGHFQLTQRSADAPLFGAKAIHEQLPLAGDMHFQRRAGNRRGIRRHRHFQPFRHPRQARALNQQGHKHDEEREIEIQLGMGQTGHQREHRQNDRYRAT